MFSGIEMTVSDKIAISSIPNASFVDNIAQSHLVTHLIVASTSSETIRRTAKLMATLASPTCENVLGVEWLISSAAVNRALPTDDFCVTSASYAKVLKEAERSFQCRLATTLSIKRRTITRPLLSGFEVFFFSALPGNSYPTKNELNAIVTCGGGRVLERLKDCPPDAQVLIVTSDPEVDPTLVASQMSFVEQVAIENVTTRIANCSDFLQIILTQEMGGRLVGQTLEK